MKSVIGAMVVLFGVVFLVLLLNPIMRGVEGFRTNEQVDQFPSTTGGGEITENVTLTKALWKADTHYATVTSNLSTDVPLETAYASGSQILTVSGLTASQSRTLTVTYAFQSLDDSIDRVAGLSPTFWMIAVIALIGLAIGAAVIGLTYR